MKKRRVRKPFVLDRYIFGAFAKIWRWWPPRREVIERCTKEFDGQESNQCEKCKEILPVLKVRGKRGKERRKRQIEVDHISPKVDPKKGFQGWDELVSRTFVQADKLQALCRTCHKAKTKDELKVRIKTRKGKKK